jgi:protocatechuate 3,4-dioxygenase beta subunit
MVLIHFRCRVVCVVYHIRMCLQSAYVAAVTTLLLGGVVDRPAWHAPALASPAQTGQPAKSNGSISGTITSEGDGTPLARARVVVRSAALPQTRIVLSDARGTFTTGGLPAGDYLVSVIRSGYALPGSLLQGLSVRLADGETRRDVNIAMQRAGTIPGTLMDEDGTPLAGADVEAVSLRAADARQMPRSIASARTDDRGEFRLTGLPSGQYLVMARDPAFNNVGDDTGVLRYAPTYYPGVLTSSEAEPVTVAVGRETARVEFRLRIVRPSRISGVMGRADRRPLLSGSVILVPRDTATAASVPPEDVEILPDGRFTFRNVAPGKYQVRARAVVDPRQVMLFGSFAVSVEGRDVNLGSIAMVPGAVLQGRVEWVTTSGATPPTTKGIRVRAPFADGTSFADAVTSDVAADGTFRIDGVMPGRHYFAIEGLPDDWTISSVMWRGRDILFSPADLHEAQQVRDVRIILSEAATELAGAVNDDSGRPVPDALVLTMPPAASVWSPVNPRMRTTRTDGQGRYRVRGLPRGAYQVSAVSAADELAIIRRGWLARVQAVATLVSLNADEKQTLNLVARHASTLTRPVSR